MAIRHSGIRVELREVILKNKPQELIRLSIKGTVPVLLLQDGRVLDESMDIMHWSLQQRDPDRWGYGDDAHLCHTATTLIDENDQTFKTTLDHYKYWDRYPEHPIAFYRKRGEEFLQRLEQQLVHHPYLICDRLTLADIAIFPFIRQFAHVDRSWFDQSPYQRLRTWLDGILGTTLFTEVMMKYKTWQPGSEPVIFPCSSSNS
jgi:glutathione S-transferase